MVSSNESLFFYDLETSGLDPRQHRIMQCAGQRTTLELQPIGDPINWVVALSDDVLPSPQAVLVTGITPQDSRRTGMTEIELTRRLQTEVCTPGTIMIGYNNIRFDDEWLRYAFYRNFYDPYEWAWSNNRSRLDLMHIVRITRALRPEGITWPFDDGGKPVNRLELLTPANNLTHTHAHDALSDVEASIELTRLIRNQQPRLFSYLLEHRTKQAVSKIVNTTEPFVASSRSTPITLHHTSVNIRIGQGTRAGAELVYDLRFDPADYAHLTPEQLHTLMVTPFEERARPDYHPFPARNLVLNQAPAVAPLSVLTTSAEQNIRLTKQTALDHYAHLLKTDLPQRLTAALALEEPHPENDDVDAALYSGFLSDSDKALFDGLRSAPPEALSSYGSRFKDPRLPELLLRYRGRNYPETLDAVDSATWQQYRRDRLRRDLGTFAQEIEAAANVATSTQLGLLMDLKLWAQSIMPTDYEEGED